MLEKMAFNKKKDKGFKVLLTIIIVIIIIGGLSGGGYYLYDQQINGIKNSYETEINTYKEKEFLNTRQVYELVADVKAGTKIEEEMVKQVIIQSEIPSNLFMTKADLNKDALVDIKANQPIMTNMLQAEEVSQDTREELLSMLMLAVDLKNGEYVDVRIGFPNGDDYIVLSKKKVRNIDIDSNMVWLWVDEDEILSMSSAIVDAYLNKGTKIYTVTYIDPSIQDAAKPTYPVKTNVLNLMKTDPNILDKAIKALTEDARKALDARLDIMTAEQKAAVDEGVKSEGSALNEKVANDATVGTTDPQPEGTTVTVPTQTETTTTNQNQSTTQETKPSPNVDTTTDTKNQDNTTEVTDGVF